MTTHRASRPALRGRRLLAGLAVAAVLFPAAACKTLDFSVTSAPDEGRVTEAQSLDSGAQASVPSSAAPDSVEDPAAIGTATAAPEDAVATPAVPDAPTAVAPADEENASAAGSASSAPPAAAAAAAAAAAPRAAAVPSGAWLSGASGTGVASGEFAAWRGSPVPIAGTWADSNVGQIELWSLDPGQEFGAWTGSIDIAIGAISAEESWRAAAGGAYDGRWRQSLQNMRAAWGARPGTVYIRLAHEMNSNWYPWSVSAGEETDFIAAWRRFRALQQEIFPSSQLVFCVNRESVGTGLDWRRTFPGADAVDVMGVDYYNQYPNVTSAADWAASLQQTDSFGAPKGLQTHLDFARSVGLPLAVPEWSAKASSSDSPAFIQGMHDFFTANAGGGAGQLLYEVQFNVDMHGDDYRLFGGGHLPMSAARYRDLF